MKKRWRDEFWLDINFGVNIKNILLLVCKEWHKESRQRTRRMRTSFAHMLTQLHGRYSPCPALTRFLSMCAWAEWSNVKFCSRIHSHIKRFIPALAPVCRHLCSRKRERYFYFISLNQLTPSSCFCQKRKPTARWSLFKFFKCFCLFFYSY